MTGEKPTTESDWLSTAEVAARLHYTQSHVRNLIRTGRLRAVSAATRGYQVRPEWIAEFEKSDGVALGRLGKGRLTPIQQRVFDAVAELADEGIDRPLQRVVAERADVHPATTSRSLRWLTHYGLISVDPDGRPALLAHPKEDA